MVLLASEYDKSKWLKSEDLTQEKKFRIKIVTEEEVGADRDKEKKLVVWFTNDPRGLVLNRINNRTIRGAFGDDTAHWRGRIIAVFPTMAEFRGKMGPALRVRIPPPKQSAATTAPPQQPGNGAAAPMPASRNGAAAPAAAAPATADPELEPDPVKPTRDEMDDEIPW